MNQCINIRYYAVCIMYYGVNNHLVITSILSKFFCIALAKISTLFYLVQRHILGVQDFL